MSPSCNNKVLRGYDFTCNKVLNTSRSALENEAHLDTCALICSNIIEDTILCANREAPTIPISGWCTHYSYIRMSQSVNFFHDDTLWIAISGFSTIQHMPLPRRPCIGLSRLLLTVYSLFRTSQAFLKQNSDCINTVHMAKAAISKKLGLSELRKWHFFE